MSVGTETLTWESLEARGQPGPGVEMEQGEGVVVEVAQLLELSNDTGFLVVQVDTVEGNQV